MAYIVLVEDDPDIRDLVEMSLARAGHEVACAGNGAEALSVCATRTPDVVIMDVNMPVMSGLEAIRRLRSVPETAVVPIIVVSAGGRGPDRDAGLAAGATCYLTKPFGLGALGTLIDSLLVERAL